MACDTRRKRENNNVSKTFTIIRLFYIRKNKNRKIRPPFLFWYFFVIRTFTISFRRSALITKLIPAQSTKKLETHNALRESFNVKVPQVTKTGKTISKHLPPSRTWVPVLCLDYRHYRYFVKKRFMGIFNNAYALVFVPIL